MYSMNIDSHRVTPRFRPLKAWSHMQKLIADKEDTEQVFHIIEALNGRALMRNLEEFAASPEGQAELKKRTYLPPLLDDHKWIRELPEGTVGRAYIDFMTREGLSAQGLVDESLKMKGSALRDYDDDLLWFGNRLRDTHDLFHILSGYNRDPLGEASLLAFSHSQNPAGIGVIFIAYVGSKHLEKHAPKAARIMECFHEGRRNGKLAKRIMEQDILALMREPLEAARARLGINSPAAYRRALEIMTPLGYNTKTQAQDAFKVQAAA